MFRLVVVVVHGACLWFKMQILIIISLMTYLRHLNLVHFCHLIPGRQNVPGNNHDHICPTLVFPLVLILINAEY